VICVFAGGIYFTAVISVFAGGFFTAVISMFRESVYFTAVINVFPGKGTFHCCGVFDSREDICHSCDKCFCRKNIFTTVMCFAGRIFCTVVMSLFPGSI